MARRQMGSEDGTVLCGCSVCPFVGRYPTEIRYCSDGLFRCNVYCTETETPTDYERKRFGKRINDETRLPFPVGVKPWWAD